MTDLDALRRLAVTFIEAYPPQRDFQDLGQGVLTLLTALDRLAAGVRNSWLREGECDHCGAAYLFAGPPVRHTPDCPVPLAEAVGRGEC